MLRKGVGFGRSGQLNVGRIDLKVINYLLVNLSKYTKRCGRILGKGRIKSVYWPRK